MLEQRCRFVEAALRFYELSLSLPARSSCIVRAPEPTDERIECLRRALLCTVLAPAGRQRTRLIGTLYRDERTQLLASPLPSFLEKMCARASHSTIILVLVTLESAYESSRSRNH